MCGGIPTGANCSGVVLPSFAGLYDDEVVNVQNSHSLIGIISNTGGPIAPILINLSTTFFGKSVFAVRLPFAIVSSVSALVVYWASKQISGKNILSLLSSLYFIIMMPALIYGRMAFAENVIALFFIITFLCTLKIKRDPSNRLWFALASIFSVLSLIVKLDGAFVALYLIIFLYKEKLLRKGFSYFWITFIFGVLLPLGLVQFFADFGLVIARKVDYFVFSMGNQITLFRSFFIDTLPSGVPILAGSTSIAAGIANLTPEFWYLVLYICLGALAFGDLIKYTDLYFAIGIFVIFAGVFSGAAGDYWIIMIQPVLAISFGPGLLRLLRMPLAMGFAFYTFVFLPLATSLGIFLFAPLLVGTINIHNYALSLWYLSALIPPAALFLIGARFHVNNEKYRVLINAFFLGFFFATLFVATFLVPVLYPYYI